MKKKLLYILILLILLSMFWIDFNKHSIYFFITFQDFSLNYLSKDIQIISSSYLDPILALCLNILLRSLGNILICSIIRKILSPLPHSHNEIIYCLIFIIFFIPVSFKGYLLIILSLFQSSLFMIFMLMNLATLPSSLLQVLCQKIYVFNDYKLSLFIGAICMISFIIYTQIIEKRIIDKNL